MKVDCVSISKIFLVPVEFKDRIYFLDFLIVVAGYAAYVMLPDFGFDYTLPITLLGIWSSTFEFNILF